MPDIKQVLSEEIRRLARKEIRIATQALEKSVSMLRHQLSEEKKTIALLEKRLTVLDKTSPLKPAAVAASPVKVRMNAKGIVRLRKKLKLTQDKLAALVGVAAHTVSLWEQGKTSPRQAQKEKLGALRSAGKRELKKQLSAITAEKKAEKPQA
ncbi:MAG: helix-turn-helix domain-containing protein [Victivallaceae bacterium]|nr:helix-turn-helix domain-containing protein [Victivallaceae bacterium]